MNIEILHYINSLEIIDTHEHLMPFETQREHNDVISEFLTHCFSVDLVTSGLPLKQLDKVRGKEMSVMEKWNCIEKYWELSKFTGYGQAVTFAASDIYGVLIRHIQQPIFKIAIITLRPLLWQSLQYYILRHLHQPPFGVFENNRFFRISFQIIIYHGVNHGSVQDLYSTASDYVELNVANITFSSAGNKSFKFNITGKNASSSGYWLALDYIKLVPN